MSLSPRYPLGWLSLLIAAGLLANAMRLRGRCRRLATLTPSEKPPDPSHRFLVAAGVELDDATRRAASAHATREGLTVLDLVPADLPGGRVLEPLGPFERTSARQAMLADAGMLERAAITQLDGLDPGEFARAAGRLIRDAAASTGLAIAPTLRAASAPDRPAQRRELLRAAYGSLLAPVLALRAALYLTLGLDLLALLAGRAFGLVALLAFCAQPAVAAGRGTALRPRGLYRSCLLRGVREPLGWLATVAGRWPPRHDLDALIPGPEGQPLNVG